MRRELAIIVAAGSFFAAATISQAAGVTSYAYDAKGRLIRVIRTGMVNNNNVMANYSYDLSDNRRAVTVTGAP